MRLNPWLSDLFFNHRHDARDAYWRTLDADPDAFDADAERAALFSDAEEFATMVEGWVGLPIPPEVLVDDFFARL